MTDLAQRMMIDASLSSHRAGRVGYRSTRGAASARRTTRYEEGSAGTVRCRESTLNEALRILQSRGVITVRSGLGGGLFAASPTLIALLGNSILSLDAAEGDVTDAVRIRDTLDPLLIEDALEHSSAADIARMRVALAVMQEAIDAGDATGFVRANWDLHAAIARVSPISS